MKTKLVLLIAMAGMFTFSSCKKCYECQYGGSPSTEKVCKPESMSQKGWKDYINDLEDNGWECN